jgi:hypothetical protein
MYQVLAPYLVVCMKRDCWDGMDGGGREDAFDYM